MDKKFTIITVSYNSENTIEQTIRSVLSQTYSNFEYIIIDGASKDSTIDIIKKYAKQDNRIHYLSEPDNGIYDAMNKGIRLATGNIVALINSDDYYECDALEKIVKKIPDDEFYVIYGMTRFLQNDKEDRVVLNSHNSLPQRMIMHPGCFVSKSVYKKYNYDTNYISAADYDLFIKLYQDKRIVFIPLYEVVANFRMGGMSSTIVSDIETNIIKYKYGYISVKEYCIKKIAIKVKSIFLS